MRPFLWIEYTQAILMLINFAPDMTTYHKKSKQDERRVTFACPSTLAFQKAPELEQMASRAVTWRDDFPIKLMNTGQIYNRYIMESNNEKY
jgi:ABC-type uncharacterized transport system YnjBCD substrate-binding protein